MNFKFLVLKHFFLYKLDLYPKNRKDLERWQNGKISDFLNKIKHHSDFYANNIRKHGSWKNFPYLNKKIMMENFDQLNTVGLKKDDAFQVAFEAENSRDFSSMVGNITVGLSSGTSGNRGLFVASSEERAKWVGYVLAKVIGSIKKPQKIAFFLRANSNLYSSVKSSKLDFNYFDMKESIKDNLKKLNDYQPDIIVSPPSMLRMIAQAQETKEISVHPHKIISVAEVLESTDKEYIKKVFKQIIHQAYQCTEGFLASTCNYGTLHFHEDIVKIEKDYIDSEKTKFFPVITDFTRTSQPIIRYRLNDIIVEKKEPCQCGSIFTAIDHIEGRSDDIFYFHNQENKIIPIFPDFFRRAVITISESEEINEYVVEEEDINKLLVRLDVKEGKFDKVAGLVKEKIIDLLHHYNITDYEINFTSKMPALGDKKLQRIKRKFQPQNSDSLLSV